MHKNNPFDKIKKAGSIGAAVGSIPVRKVAKGASVGAIPAGKVAKGGALGGALYKVSNPFNKMKK